MKIYNIIGVMSGTSLDGMDVALCEFFQRNNGWHFNVLDAKTYSYSNDWKNTLRNLESGNALNFYRTHIKFGHYIGSTVKSFIEGKNIRIDAIASHGHTIFHRPDEHFTCQIGDGAAIAAETRLPVINDFRSLDVALQGQGAPLVPIGDMLLFSQYEQCLNIGGFANISFTDHNNKRIAFDICMANIILNYLAEKLGKKYDENGAIAKKGTINNSLLEKLNNLEFYSKPYPKSLGKEWVLENVLPIIDNISIDIEDLLATFTYHIGFQISEVINSANGDKVLVTGGGAYNSYLIDIIKSHTKKSFIIPDNLVVEFKEAIIFAFLGLLRLLGYNNCISSVTGALSDNCGGALYNPKTFI